MRDGSYYRCDRCDLKEDRQKIKKKSYLNLPWPIQEMFSLQLLSHRFGPLLTLASR